MPTSSSLKDRIVEFRRVPGRELAANPRNWREHPETQRAALAGILKAVGIAGVLLAYYSPRNEGKLTLIDGHLRQEDYADVDWPTVILDVDDAEADALLASHDPLVALARRDQDKLDALLDDVRAWNKDSDLDKLFDSLHSEQADAAHEPDSAPPTQYIVLIQCVDEAQQAELLERLAEEGLSVRALVS